MSFWPSHVINMAANTRRMENSARQLDGFGLPRSRIEAVDGRALPPAEVARVHDAARARSGKSRSRRGQGLHNLRYQLGHEWRLCRAHAQGAAR